MAGRRKPVTAHALPWSSTLRPPRAVTIRSPLSVRGVGKYLKRWGFTPQKPIKKAYEQCPEAVKKWMDEDYPAIAERAKAEGGEIHWGDETALVNTNVRGRSYAPKGKTPVTYVPGTHQKLSMISTVTTRARRAG
jgi:hypothetical protein